MKKLIGALFSKEKINSSRQREVDLLRGFSLLILCVCHVGLFLSNDSKSGLYYFSDIIGSEPVAPVLMVLMGLSIVFSKKQTPMVFLKRGILLLIGGYMLNVVRSFPYWIVGDLDFFACVSGFFVVDIFQFAGLAFLLFALFKKLKMPYWSMFLFSLLFLVTGQILMSFPDCLKFPKEATYVLNIFLPLNNAWCCFNLLTWFVYPCFGLIIGELLIRCRDKNKFYLILLVLGSLGTIALYLNIGLRFPNYTEYYYGGNYYRMGVLNSFITCLFVCFLLALWHFVGKIIPSFCQIYLFFLSKNISVFYVLSWLLLAPVIHLWSYYQFNLPPIAIVGIMIALILLCSFLSWAYRKIALPIKTRLKAKR